MIRQILAILLTIVFFACESTKKENWVWKYPNVKSDTGIDIYFGKKVIDPYRNLEQLSDSMVRNWFVNQKEFSDSVLNNITGRDSLKKEIEHYYFSSNIYGTLPRLSESQLFFNQYYTKSKNNKLFYKDERNDNLFELICSDSVGIDTNDKYIINYYEPSYDGKYLIFSIKSRKTEIATLRILNVSANRLLNDKIESVSWARPIWMPNNQGFFYLQLKPNDKNKKKEGIYEESRVIFHNLNNSEIDKDIFSKEATSQIKIDKLDFPSVYVSPVSEIALATLIHGSSIYSEIYYAYLNELIHLQPSAIRWKKICTYEDKIVSFSLMDTILYVISFKNNFNGQLIKINIENPDTKEILIDAKEMVLEEIIQNKSAVFIKVLKNGYNLLYKLPLSDEKNIVSVNLPFEGTIDIRPNEFMTSYLINSNDLVFGISSWSREWDAYHYNSEDDKIKRLNTKPIGQYSIPKNITVKEIEIKSFDGEKVPLSIVYPSDIKFDGSNPAILNGYGAYGVSITSNYDVTRLTWFNKGGIYAVAHVRGGGEKGERWRLAGYKSRKSTSWKDYIACAEYLIKNKYTSSNNLVAEGGSAGGITIGRAITERPNLFGSAVIWNGTMTTLRRAKSINTASIAEYGDENDSIEFQYLLEMDSYHHLKDDLCYPSFFITTGMNETRVSPWITGKFVARLQNNTTTANPILFRVSNEGHFGTYDYINLLTDYYVFMFWQVGHPEFTFNESKLIESP